MKPERIEALNTGAFLDAAKSRFVELTAPVSATCLGFATSFEYNRKSKAVWLSADIRVRAVLTTVWPEPSEHLHALARMLDPAKRDGGLDPWEVYLTTTTNDDIPKRYAHGVRSFTSMNSWVRGVATAYGLTIVQRRAIEALLDASEPEIQAIEAKAAEVVGAAVHTLEEEVQAYVDGNDNPLYTGQAS